jgi:hypothetical protein
VQAIFLFRQLISLCREEESMKTRRLLMAMAALAAVVFAAAGVQADTAVT